MEEDIIEYLDMPNKDAMSAIGKFAILWNYFENFMDKNFGEITDKPVEYGTVYDLIDRIALDDSSSKKIDDMYALFRDYVEGIGNHAFNLENIEREFLDVSKGEYIGRDAKKIFGQNDQYSRLKFLYYITKKVRNNMFHGNDLKTIKKLDGQIDLFSLCTKLLAFLCASFENGRIYLSSCSYSGEPRFAHYSHPFENIKELLG